MTPSQFRDRLQERADLARVAIGDDAIDKLEAYYHLLRQWNRTINLTALPLDSLEDEAVDRMLVEPVAAARQMRDSVREWFDLGSGGGSPAIPMRIVRPAGRLTLIEARSRKAAFLREVARELTLGDVVVVADRFETVAMRPELAGTADLITVRAVRVDAALFDAARRLSKPSADLFLFVTRGAPLPSSSKFLPSRVEVLLPWRESELVVQTAA